MRTCVVNRPATQRCISVVRFWRVTLASAAFIATATPAGTSAVPATRDLRGIAQVGNSVLVADRRANAILVVGKTHALRVLARIPAPNALAKLDAGHIVVASGRQLLRVDTGTGRTAVLARLRTPGPIAAIAPAADGMYVAAKHGTSVLRVDSHGKTRVVLANRADIQGLLLQRRVLAVCQQNGAWAGAKLGTFFTFDLSRGQVVVQQDRIGNPSGVAPAPSGWFVSDSVAGRISVVRRDGSIKRLVELPGVTALAGAPDGTIVATTLGGHVARIYPQTGTVVTIAG